MSAMWKFDLPVDDSQLVEMPADAELLHVGAQQPLVSDVIQLWARVDQFVLHVQRRILIRGTGHQIDPDVPYVGTVIVANGQLVWHVFDGGEVPW